MRPFFSTSPEPAARRRARRAPSMGSGVSRREFLRAIPVSLLAVGCSRRRYDPQPIPRCRSLGRRAVRSAFVRRGFQRRDRARASGASASTCAASACSSSRTWSSTNPGTAINTNPLVVIGAAVAFRTAGAAEVVVGEGPGTPARHGVSRHPDGPLRSPARASHPLRRPESGRRAATCRSRADTWDSSRSRCRSRCCARISSSRCQS